MWPWKNQADRAVLAGLKQADTVVQCPSLLEEKAWPSAGTSGIILNVVVRIGNSNETSKGTEGNL